MNSMPKAVESFENERVHADETSSVFMDHPIERLKYHIGKTGGTIIRSEFSHDGTAYVTWQSGGLHYRAWSSWPDAVYKIDWRPMP